VTEPSSDQVYYKSIPPGSLGERLTLAARDRIYNDFMHICAPTKESTILDVGVSGFDHKAANILEKRYPHQSRLTAAGTNIDESFQKEFPLLRYVRIHPGEPLPFKDNEFDLATSNAVLEHVGSREKQVEFLSELHRVARRVFITLPNRFFPVEHHTAIPLFQFWDWTFKLACRLLGHGEWALEENLILMSKCRLKSLASPFGQFHCGYTGIRLGLFSSNIYLYLTE